MKWTILTAMAAWAMIAPVQAHDAKGKHGGRIADAGDYRVELVSKGDAVEVYVNDHDDKPVALAGYKGLAILSAGGKTQRIVLEAGDDRLTGKAAGALPPQPKGVVQITPPGGKTVSAKF
jgi:hypothetical protein